MNLFETLIHPDREEHPERAEVVRAANLLQIGEFQLLQLAYREWFGNDMPAGESDSLFGAYMIRNQVPSWARHYARQILGLDAAGMLDENDPSYHRYDPDYRTKRQTNGVRQFCAASAMIVFALGGGIWLSHQTVGPTSQILPPYFSDKVINGVGAGNGVGPNPTP